MKRLFILIALSLVALSCAPEEYKYNGFTFDQRVYEVDYRGGTITIHFTLDGERVMPNIWGNDSWAPAIEKSASSLTLEIEMNYGKEREDDIYFSNPRNGDEAYITIRQEGYKGKKMIDISVSDITTRCCTAKAKATSKNMLLISFMDNNEYIDEDINEWRYIVRRIVNNHKKAAQEQDMSFVDYLTHNNIGDYGSIERHYDDLLPGYMMNFGAFGISYDEESGEFELLTPIYYKSFHCKTPQKRDITFRSDIAVNGADIEFSIDPGSWEGYYAYNIISKVRSSSYFPPQTTIDEQIHVEWAKNWYNEYHRMVINGDMTQDEFLNHYCTKGRTTHDATLYAMEDYLFIAYAIDIVEGVPQIVSPLHYKHFSTKEVERCDLTVDVVFKEIYGRMVRIDIIPSNDKDSYVAGIKTKQEVDSTPEATIIGSLTAYIDPINDVKYGKHSAEASLLEPNTEYVVCVVGTHGNMITTDLMCFEFQTGEAEPCAVAVENITIVGPYSLHDLYEYDSSYVDSSYLEIPESLAGVCWYEIETNGEPYKIFSGLIETRQFDKYDEEYLYDTLLRNPSTNLETYFISYEEEMVVLCRLMDDRGNLSEIYRSEPVVMHMEDNRDPSELAEVLDRMSGRTRSASSKISDTKHPITPRDNTAGCHWSMWSSR